MPTLVKIGFSRKDPALRAKELNNTGTPHPYNVAYDVLIHGPRDIEKRVHRKLADVREGKEWFKCSVSRAIEEIKDVVGGDALIEKISDRGAASPGIVDALRTDLTTTPSLSAGPASSPGSSPSQPRRTTTGTYRGVCPHCQKHFSVTLTRYDTVAKCPRCFRMCDVSKFMTSALLL